jgi:hypothetical protein
MQMPLVASVGEPRPAPKAQGEPTSLGCTPARPRPIQTASRRAAAFEGLTGWPSIWSTSTPRQTLWFDTRRVPLTNQEWPVRKHDTRSRYWPAAATSRARTRRSSRGEAKSPAGRQPAPLVKVRPLGARATGGRSGAVGGWGSWSAGRWGRPPATIPRTLRACGAASQTSAVTRTKTVTPPNSGRRRRGGG